MTPLHYADFNRELEICKCLIENGADVNASDKVSHLLYPTCTVCMQRGTNLKQIQDGSTLLHFVACQGQLDICRWLIQVHGQANVNVQDYNGDTPLLIALENRHWEIAYALIQSRANVNIAVRNTALDLAFNARESDLIVELIRNDAISKQNPTSTKLRPLYELVNRSVSLILPRTIPGRSSLGTLNIDITKRIVDSYQRYFLSDRTSSSEQREFHIAG